MLSSILANFEYAFEVWKSNPFLWVLLLFLFVKFAFRFAWNVNPPIHVEGSLVKEIENQAQWNTAVETVKKSGATVVVDFYATWCPPCKRAAPVFAAFSKLYAQDDSKCQFWKVDVDKCAGVSRANQVRGMPTFKIFQNAVEVDQLVGWDADALEAKIKRCVKIVAPTEVKEAEVVSADKSS